MNKLYGNPLTLLLNFIQDLAFLILPSFCKLGCQYRMYIHLYLVMHCYITGNFFKLHPVRAEEC